MSTDHQRYSAANQSDAIRKYATERGLVVVRTYSDEGKSGLSIEHRAGLQALINDVQSGHTDYRTILVYDISRWGRFQDTDESAYYEYLCKRQGVNVVYCAEPFENDGTPTAVIMKSIKRAMAGEYSRELSSKVFMGQCRLIELGFRQGGYPGYGLRRLVLGEDRKPKGHLGPGEIKGIQSDRVVLVPGPDEEVEVVRSIFDMYVHKRLRERGIAKALNESGHRNAAGNPWRYWTVREILTNEKYIGNNVYNQTSFKLSKIRVSNPPNMWVRAVGAFAPVVDPHMFFDVARIIAERRRIDDSAMLEHLRTLHRQTGKLTAKIIGACKTMPSHGAFQARFGSLLRAYALAGCLPGDKRLRLRILLSECHEKLLAVIADRLRDAGAVVEPIAGSTLLRVNGEFTALLVVARCKRSRYDIDRWPIPRVDPTLSPDITIVARMASDHRRIFDYYLFPGIDLPSTRASLAEDNPLPLDAYRFDSLDALYALARRSALPIAA
jgi:DNA invertase Pin-like site-specific DNA recombinase